MCDINKIDQLSYTNFHTVYSFLPHTQYDGEDFVEHLKLMQKYRTKTHLSVLNNVWILKIRLVQEYPGLYPSLQSLWWQLELHIWLVFQILPQLQTTDCGWWSRLSHSFDSLGLKANLGMACYYCHLPDNSVDPLISTYAYCTLLHVVLVTDIAVLLFFPAAHCYFFPFGMFSEKFKVWVIMFKGKGFYSFTNYFFYFVEILT
jgi:hypothetical protein